VNSPFKTAYSILIEKAQYGPDQSTQITHPDALALLILPPVFLHVVLRLVLLHNPLPSVIRPNTSNRSITACQPFLSCWHLPFIHIHISM